MRILCVLAKDGGEGSQWQPETKGFVAEKRPINHP